MNYSKDQFRMMVDNIPALAWSCRADGATEFLNQRWLDYTGLSLEEALGWGWKAAIHPEDVEKLMNTWLRFLAAGEPGEEEARLRRFERKESFFSSWRRVDRDLLRSPSPAGIGDIDARE